PLPATELPSNALISVCRHGTNPGLLVSPNEGGLVMPRYFFHLSFGDRLLPDDEGVELPSRGAARQEAQAVVRELSSCEGNRWASWFVRVADHRGQFLSVPIGRPALEVVSNDGPRSDAAPWQESPEATSDRTRAAALAGRAAALFAEVMARRRRTAHLLEM